jgi:hypothetical protein
MGNVQKVKNANLIKSGETIAVNLENGGVVFINTNLIKNLLEIPYIKKDGTKVTEKDLKAQKEKRQIAKNRKVTA